MGKEINLNEALDDYQVYFDKKVKMEANNDTGINYNVLVATLATMDKLIDAELDKITQAYYTHASND